VQATDYYVGTLGARIVLVDDAEVRAVTTASWLRQMGWQDVFVLTESGTETAQPAVTPLGEPPQATVGIDCAALADLTARDQATIVDLSLSRDYLMAHIPGAWFAIRARLAGALCRIPLRGTLILTSEDGTLAGIAAAEAAELAGTPVRFLEGGNAAWRAAGLPLTADEAKMADDAVDVWLKPYERLNDTAQAMTEYLSWEVDLPARIERDGSTRFIKL
jgi:rhodanese-related sulfurtransferase